MPLSNPAPLAFISSALAPVVALSVCALLVSNAQTQYSALIDRLRALNAERFAFALDPTPPGESQALRIKSLDHQIPVIFYRAHYLRNAIFLLFSGMMFVLLSSFMIISGELFSGPAFALASKGSFLAGLVCVFLALLALLGDVHMTFRVVRYELGLFDKQAAKQAERAFRDY